MALSLDAITDISRAVVLRHDHDIEVIGVTSTEGGSNRVELLLALSGCHDEPCRIVLNINRVDAGEFERDLRSKLDEALRHHLQPRPSE